MSENSIDLSELPRFGTRGISWKKSVGYTVQFIFDNEEGKLRIVSYDKKSRNLIVDYNGKETSINISNLLECNLSYVVGKRRHGFYYDVNQLIVQKNSTIQIIEQKRVNGRKYYIYLCKKCGTKDTIYEGHLKDNHGCPVCAGSKCLTGYNDIATTDPELCNYFIEKNYVLTQSIGTKVKGIAKCPNCGLIKKIHPSTIKFQGFGCNRCSDGLSFPSKFFTSFLCQLNEVFIPEWNPDWAKGKKYDFYLPNRHMIIEVHGRQHYEGGFERAGGNTYKKEHENDMLKEKMALHNGFSKEEYIVIDGRISEQDFLMQSIMSSKIYEELVCDNVDWEECARYAEKSLVITTCELWKSGKYTNTEEIAELLGLSRSTIIHMLNKGNKYGWCEYNGLSERNRTLRNNSEDRKRGVLQYDINGKLINRYDSISEAEQITGCRSANIIGCAKKLYNTVGGYVWRYIDDTEPLEIIINKNFKSVVQYTRDGEKIKVYKSVVDAAKQTGISRNIIYCFQELP